MSTLPERRTPGPAIPARHRPSAASAIYRGLVRPAVRRQFHRVWLRVDGELPHGGPLIAYLNHPSWWDGYAAMLLDRDVLRGAYTSYVMMDEAQLARYRFFRWCGAFSVNRGSPTSALASVEYATRLLAGHPDRALWIFPQGELQPDDSAPLSLYTGVARIALGTAATMLPAAVRLEFGRAQRPEMFLRVGPAHPVVGTTPATVTADLTARLARAVEELRDDVRRGDRQGYSVLLRGRMGIDRRWDRIRGRRGTAER